MARNCGARSAYCTRSQSHGSGRPISSAGLASAGSNEYATASRSWGRSPPSSRHQAIAFSGSSHAANGSGRLPCLRREKRSSSAAATTRPSTTRAADGSWNRALTPRTRMGCEPSSFGSSLRVIPGRPA
ncbi:Uncharacterised protein [Mycobacteroides abscessus]|nr:Uncharacterised protein [Mycobacteroides abscessus]